MLGSRRAHSGRWSSGPALAAATLVVALLLARAAAAHQVGLSRGVYLVDGTGVTAEITLARGELRDLVPDVDADRDGALSDAELAGASASLQARLVDRVALSADGRACAGTLTRAALTEEDGAAVVAAYQCPAAPRRLQLRLDVLDGLSRGHRQLATFARPGADLEDSLAEHVLHGRQPQVEVAVGGAEPASPSTPPVGDYFILGIEHILIGIDHLVFLLGLVVVGGRWRALLAVVTAFTLGHSLSLALATLQVWTPPGAWIEPAIAASIAYVGVENFFKEDAAGRWRITLPFGFVHGFGFAGALGDIGVPQSDVGLALLLFNLGVEAGQLLVLAPLLPLLAWLRGQAWFASRGPRAISAAIVVAGLYWFFERI